MVPQAADDLDAAAGSLGAVAQRLNASPRVQALRQLSDRLNNPAQPRLAPVQRAVETTPSGSGLPAALRHGIESLSGLSMGDVTVHRNSSEPAQLQALAYAKGSDIHLAPGQERHLPHEAWHVVQQKQGRVSPTLQMKDVAINDDPGLEREADVMGEKAVQRQADPADAEPAPEIRNTAGGGAAQRIVAVDAESAGNTLKGYTNSLRYKALTSAQQARYKAMHGRQQDEFRFASVDELHQTLSTDAAGPAPTNILRAGDNFGEASEPGFSDAGVSKYVNPTRPNLHHWQRYLQLHRNKALDLVPADVAHDDARSEIATLYTDTTPLAVDLDSSSLPPHRRPGFGPHEIRDLVDDISELRGPQKIQESVEKMYAIVQTATGDLGRPGPEITVPHFGGITSTGMASWAYIQILKGSSFPEGSSAGGTYTDLPWEGRLHQRRTPDNGNVYIRGHLLNDHLGGPSAGYNLVPLVGTDVPGAPNTNDAHSALVEGQARAAFKSISRHDNDGSKSPTGPQYGGIRYFVKVTKYGGFDVESITSELELETLRGRVHASIAAEKLGKGTAALTVGDLKDYLGRSDLVGQERYQREWSDRLKKYLRTVGDTDQDGLMLEALFQLMTENVALWKWEAANLPHSLSYHFQLLDGFRQSMGTVATDTIPAGPVMNPFMKFKK